MEDSRTFAVFPTTELKPKDFRSWMDTSKTLVTITPNYASLLEALEKGSYYTGPERGLCLYGTPGQLAIDTINGKEANYKVDALMEGISIDIAFNADIMIASVKSVGEGLKIELLELSRGNISTMMLKIADEASGHYLMPITHRKRL